MRLALQQAQRAFHAGEVPVGAVVVANGVVIAQGYNHTELLSDVTAHAELLCITAASEYLGGKYLTSCTLYVTLEPCLMCGGALFWSKIGRVVWGASDPRRGISSLSQRVLHPKTLITSGILAQESELLLKSFFAANR